MSDEFDDFFDDAVDPTENPAEANAQIAALLEDDETPFGDVAPVALPDISFPTDGPVTLPGGLVTYDEDDNEQTVKQAEVVELNGVAEEALAKARNSDNIADYVATLLRHGVATLGGKKASDDSLDELLQGDREYLVLEIRRATYGDEIELGTVQCEKCEEEFDLMTGAVATIAGMNSDAYAPLADFQVQSVSVCPKEFMFPRKAYYIDATMNKLGPNGNPGLPEVMVSTVPC
jgi:hypothetical protein